MKSISSNNIIFKLVLTGLIFFHFSLVINCQCQKRHERQTMDCDASEKSTNDDIVFADPPPEYELPPTYSEAVEKIGNNSLQCHI